MPLRKVHELTFLWFGLPGPLLISKRNGMGGERADEVVNGSETAFRWGSRREVPPYVFFALPPLALKRRHLLHSGQDKLRTKLGFPKDPAYWKFHAIVNQKSREGGVRDWGVAQICRKLRAKFSQNCQYFVAYIRGRVRKIVANLSRI